MHYNIVQHSTLYAVLIRCTFWHIKRDLRIPIKVEHTEPLSHNKVYGILYIEI